MTIVVTPSVTQVVTVQSPISRIVNIVTPGPQGDTVILIAPTPTYDISGRLTEINFNTDYLLTEDNFALMHEDDTFIIQEVGDPSNGYRKTYTYDANGNLSTITFYQPNMPTTRTTLTWVEGRWAGTSTPEVI